ncbi:MFS transporter [Desulfovibrio sp. OttesenSCG-928-C14]|nr:MFS transporter [Desulfovibrio sp. OttesenSCG-928-C14]
MNKVNTDGQADAPGALLILLLVCLTNVISMFLRTCPAILALDLQASFQTGPGVLALLSSATLIGYGIMQLPSGLITDAFGGRKTLSAFLLLAALATAAFALAPHLPLAVGARLLTGLSVAMVPAGGAILALYFSPARYPQALSLLMASSSLGSLMASEPLARLSGALGWQGAILLAGGISALLGLVIFKVIKEKKPAAGGPAGVQAGGPSPWRIMLRNAATVMGSKAAWPLMLWSMLASAVYFSIITMWGGPYLILGCGFSQMEASRVLLFQGGLTFFSIPLVSSLTRFFQRRTIVIACTLCGLAALITMALYVGRLPGWLLVPLFLTVSTSSTAGATCIFALFRDNFPVSLTGTGIGCGNMLWPISASALNVLFGNILSWRLTAGFADAGAQNAAGPEALERLVNVGAYGFTWWAYVGIWAGALVVAVFFIREKFEVRVPKI